MESLAHSQWVCRFAERLLSLGSRASISALYRLGCQRFEVCGTEDPGRAASAYVATFGLPTEPEVDVAAVPVKPIAHWLHRFGLGSGTVSRHPVRP